MSCNQTTENSHCHTMVNNIDLLLKTGCAFFLSFLIAFLSFNLFGHGTGGSVSQDEIDKRAINFPDTQQYLTLITDLHTHSVFSDGHVWPNIRVLEALRDGIDALAITEHLEHQPHRTDILNPDRNKAYEEAKAAAGRKDILIVNGSEITRDMPPGHINAIFIKDANKLFNIDPPKNDKTQEILNERIREMKWGNDLEKEYYSLANIWPAEEAIEAANRQGAFLFWNHPMWTSQSQDGVARLTPMHKDLIAKGYLHGIEVVNGNSYSEEAFQIAIENNLAIIGTSDVHNLIDWDYKPHLGGHRPVTLIFARYKNITSIKQALFERRTVIWFKNKLFGLKENLDPLLNASLSIESASYLPGTKIVGLTISNISDAKFLLKNASGYTFANSDDLVEVPAQGTKYLQVKTLEKINLLTLNFGVLNALIAPGKHAKISLKIRIY